MIIDYVTSSKHKRVTGNASSTSCSASACLVCVGESLGLPSYPPEAPHDQRVCPRRPYDSGEEGEDSSQDVKASLLFCPSRIWAFSLSHKSWGLISPTEIKAVCPQEDAFNEIETADERHKMHLESALVAHLKCGHGINGGDTLTRKGRGFTILLTGSHGTGKTLIAGK